VAPTDGAPHLNEQPLVASSTAVARLWRHGACAFLCADREGTVAGACCQDFALAIAAVVSYLAIIFIHEFGHAAVAHWLGYEVNATTNQKTTNKGVCAPQPVDMWE
jgi:hypothetical protein